MKRTSILYTLTLLLVVCFAFSSCSKDNGELHPTHQLLLGKWDVYEVIFNNTGEVDTYPLDGILDTWIHETEACGNLGCVDYSFNESNESMIIDGEPIFIDLLNDTDLVRTASNTNITQKFKRLPD